MAKIERVSESLGERIKRYRVRQGMHQEELARKAGISRNYLWQIEQDKANPTQAVLLPIATTLGVPLSELLGENKKEPNIPINLKMFAEKYKLPPEDVKMLASIQYRGHQPETEDEWRSLYNYIRVTLSKHEEL